MENTENGATPDSSGGGSFRNWTEEQKARQGPPRAARTDAGEKATPTPHSGTEARRGGARAPSSPDTSAERSELLELRREALDIRAEAREMREEGKAFRSEAEEMRKAATERMEASRKFANTGATELRKFTAKAEELTKKLEATGQEAVQSIRAEAKRQGADVAKAIKRAAKEQAGRVLNAMEERQGELIRTTTEAAEQMRTSATRSARQVESERRQLKKTVSERERSARWSADKIERAARAARQTTWKSWAIIAAVAVLLPTTFMLGMTWMRPGWGLTDHQRSGMETGTAVIERYNGTQEELQTSLDAIGKLESGQDEKGRALAEWQREDLREQVMTLEKMQQNLEQMREIRGVMGWTPTEYAQELARQVKALQVK